MDTQQLLEHLARTMGVEGLAFNADGCACLMFDGRIALNLESDRIADRLHLHVELGALPSQGREAVYRALLEGNLFGAQTGEATLAVDKAADTVVLCQALRPEELSGATFIEAVQAMVSCADVWQKALADGSLGGELPAAAAAANSESIDTPRGAGGGPWLQV
jgi:hypothetical protein